MVWTYLLNDTHNGKKLKLSAPFEVEVIQLIEVENPEIYGDRFARYGFEFGGKVIYQIKSMFFDTEKEATKHLLQFLQDFFEWVDDPNNAPPKNVPEWKQKAGEMLKCLQTKYLEEYPEVFI